MKHDLTPNGFANNHRSSAGLIDFWLCGKDGNKITKSDIDILGDHPLVDIVKVSSLDQETFEYLIENYGNQFRYIYFFKNKAVEDWSLLGKLPNLEYIHWYWNQKIDKFWDMSGNISLAGIDIADFTRLKSIDGIETAPNLKVFGLGNVLWSKWEIESFKPVSKCEGIEYVYFYGKKILDTDFSFVKDMKSLKQLSLNNNILSTEQYAWIVGNCPQLKGERIEPAWTFDHSSYTWVSVFGKGKRGFNLEGNEEKLKKIEADFWELAESLKDKPYPG